MTKNLVIEWIDDRIDTLRGDLNIAKGTDKQLMIEVWIDDFEEVGRRLSDSSLMCTKYNGKWISGKCKRKY